MSNLTALPPIAFIGGGNMGSAIIAGIKSRYPDADICVCDPSAEIRAKHEANGIRTSDDPASCLAGAEVIVLAVKPQIAGDVLKDLALHLRGDHPADFHFGRNHHFLYRKPGCGPRDSHHA